MHKGQLAKAEASLMLQACLTLTSHDSNIHTCAGCYRHRGSSQSCSVFMCPARSWFNNGTPSDTELRTLADAPRPQLDPWKFPRLKRFYLPGPHMEPPVMQGMGGCWCRAMRNQQTALAMSSDFQLVVTVARCCKVGFVPSLQLVP